ncbi:MAG: apolipoprotein N-acyltransferase [Acidimicrobiia bacterium]|nr:apolipoprotein N-acyltransferase [Acidimicrobiia bacterium]
MQALRLVPPVLASAALMWAAFPPLDLGFLVFVAPAPLLWALRRVRSLREASWLGFLYAGAFFGALLGWIAILGFVAWIPLTLAMAAYGAAYGALMYLVREWTAWRWWLVAVGGWAAWDFVRARFPFGGFPWGAPGWPVGTLAWPRGAAQWIGPTGWAVLVIGFAAGLVLLTDEERDRRPLEIVTGVVVGLTVLGAVFAPSTGGGEIRTAIVQGDSPCPGADCPNEKQIIYNNHLRLTRTLIPDAVDFVVWGENAFGGAFNPTFNPEVAAQIGGEAERLGAYILASGTRPGGPGRFENVNVLFGPDGTILGEYLKRHPVPFGEYVPFRELLEFIPQLDQVPNDMVRGTGPVVWPMVVNGNEAFLGSVISFEGAFPRIIRSEVKAGAQLMVVATNEASYGISPASDQLIGMVRLTAASLGVDTVLAAVTGQSTFIGADGSVGPKTPLYEEAVLVDRVRFQRSRPTLYARVGDWLQVVAVVAAAVTVATRAGRAEFKIRPEARV